MTARRLAGDYGSSAAAESFGGGQARRPQGGVAAGQRAHGDRRGRAAPATQTRPLPPGDQVTKSGFQLSDEPASLIVPALVLAAAWLAGDSARSRRAYLAETERRARDAERDQDQRAGLAAAAERERITRELHDVIAHAPSVVVIQAHGGIAVRRSAGWPLIPWGARFLRECLPRRNVSNTRGAHALSAFSLAEMRYLIGSGAVRFDLAATAWCSFSR